MYIFFILGNSIYVDIIVWLDQKIHHMKVMLFCSYILIQSN
jgi:hypothetical protein